MAEGIWNTTEYKLQVDSRRGTEMYQRSNFSDNQKQKLDETMCQQEESPKQNIETDILQMELNWT